MAAIACLQRSYMRLQTDLDVLLATTALVSPILGGVMAVTAMLYQALCMKKKKLTTQVSPEKGPLMDGPVRAGFADAGELDNAGPPDDTKQQQQQQQSQAHEPHRSAVTPPVTGGF